MLQIRDNIHGYITLDGIYAHIVNTPEFQRLRTIEQGSFRPVFPGARHDRFIHSLGTYHLATKFVDHFFRNLPKDVPGVKVPAADEKKLKATFRYAALLHDIGHAPFSHTTEGFFLEQEDPARPGTPLIWTRLCEAVQAAAPAEYDLFRNPPKPSVGAPHEIMSAILLVSNVDKFVKGKERADIDPALAARMVIGYLYSPTDPGCPTDPDGIRALGIRNCLIQLLNSSILDVDRLDYLGRDTQMSGFVNAPLDLDCLAASVTAVVMPDGWLAPAYRDMALSVFDLMFQAKLSHDAWVLANPAGPYDAALLAHCIRRLNEKIDKDYMKTIFSVEALSQEGVTLKGKHYRLLSDVDVSADLKAQSGDAYDELYTRELGKRRIAVWRSYFEFHHIFNDPDNGVTPEDVTRFFDPLIQYMEKRHLFVFDKDSYAEISKCPDRKVTWPADFLRTYLMGLTTDPGKKEQYNVVLLGRSNNFTMKVDPAQIRILFNKNNIPLRAGRYNYSTYDALTGVSVNDKRSSGYFYLYRHHILGHKQLAKLRKSLSGTLRAARANGLL